VKILFSEGGGSGFFFKFLRNKKPFYCLMTNNHVITPRLINKNKEIRLFYENETKQLDIILNKAERIIVCLSELYELDITIVEMIPKDKVDESYFLDKYNFQGGNINLENYIGREIQTFQYPLGQILSSSEGIILGNYTNNAYIFTHTAETKHGSSGSPIVLKGDDKVLAIHKGKLVETGDNVGILVEIIVDIMKDYKKNGHYVEYYENGALKYDGKFKDDIYHDDSGTYVDLNGEMYLGPFRNGIREGEGKEYYESGKIKYHGTFSNDQYNDKNGMFYEETGWKYNGEFKNGKKNGHCIYMNDRGKTIMDGKFYDDEFIDGDDHSTPINKIKDFFGSVKHVFSPVGNFFGVKCKKCEHLLKNHEPFCNGWLKCNDCSEGDNTCPYN
jgi:hypothetical protein